ncbi:MAG TPA: RsmE family RNA methyltransferase [Kofleriaceae bacterium]|nr:RsmE family RNA methyltransferase [Kofleriaceae bacterium]
MRIFVAPAALVAGELAVRGDEHHYLSHVRRVRVGDAVELVDGAGRRAPATVTAITADATTLTAGAPEAIAARLPTVRALIPLIKGDRMDVCIEKLVEVGVDAITVWPAARAVVRLDGARRAARVAKYQELARAAARQSGRAHVPSVTASDDLAAAIAALPQSAGRFVLDPASDAPLEAGPLAALADVAVISGPEGGFAPDELARLTQAGGFAPLGLGPRVLRAETAPVVAVALLRALTKS